MRKDAEPSSVPTFEPGEDALIELANGRFVDVVNDRYFPSDVRVLVQGGRIRALRGLPGEPLVPAPDFVVDLQGRSVFPGLFNTHCHVSLFATSNTASLGQMRLARKYRDLQIRRNLSECLAHGITNLRDCYSADLGFPRRLVARIRRGEIAGPRLHQSVVVGPLHSYLSPRQTPLWRVLSNAMGSRTLDYRDEDSGSVVFPPQAGEREVRDAVDRAIDQRGAQFIKIGEQRESLPSLKPELFLMTEAQLAAVADQAGRRGLKTTMHHVSVESFRRAVRCGVSSLAHLPVDAALTAEDVDAAKRSGCIVEPTVSVTYDLAWPVAGDRAGDHPDMSKLCSFRDATWSFLAEEFYVPEVQESVKRTYRDLSRGVMKIMGFMDAKSFYRYHARAAHLGAANLRLLYDAGVPLGCGNDGGIAPCSPAALKYEVAMFDLTLNNRPGVRRFSAADALRLATVDSARALGLERDFGSIARGKVADLVVVDGDPLRDLHVVGDRVAALFLDGKLAVNNGGLAARPAAGA